MSLQRAKQNANRSRWQGVRLALLLLVTWGNTGLIACGPVIRCLVSEMVSVTTPLEEESETLTEVADSSEDNAELQRTRRSLPRSNCNLNPLLSKFRIDQPFALLSSNASHLRCEFEFMNGCGATLRC